jgi:hypothetical protein
MSTEEIVGVVAGDVAELGEEVRELAAEIERGDEIDASEIRAELEALRQSHADMQTRLLELTERPEPDNPANAGIAESLATILTRLDAIESRTEEALEIRKQEELPAETPADVVAAVAMETPPAVTAENVKPESGRRLVSLWGKN